MGEKDFKIIFKPLKDKVEDYCYFNGLVRESLINWDSVVGVNCHANIFYKKIKVIGKVQEHIDSLNLPLRINDYSSSSPYFQIVLKEL